MANRATQHLYIVNPLKKHSEVENLMSTHPPILERINRLRALIGPAAARFGRLGSAGRP